MAPGEVEHDVVAHPRRERQRRGAVGGREGGRRDGAAAGGPGEREHGVGEELDAPQRRGELARLGVGGDGGGRDGPQRWQRQRRGVLRDRVGQRRAVRGDLEAAPVELDQDRRRRVARVEQEHDAHGPGALGERADGGAGGGEPGGFHAAKCGGPSPLGSSPL